MRFSSGAAGEKPPPSLVFGIIVVLACLLGSAVASANAQSAQAPAVQQKIGNAFALVQDAANSGGNVTSLVDSLNLAAQLVIESQLTSNSTRASAILSEASSIADNVTAAAPAVKAQGILTVTNNLLISVIEVAAIAITCALLYIYLPRAYWRLWARAHADWVVEPK